MVSCAVAEILFPPSLQFGLCFGVACCVGHISETHCGRKKRLTSMSVSNVSLFILWFIPEAWCVRTPEAPSCSLLFPHGRGEAAECGRACESERVFVYAEGFTWLRGRVFNAAFSAVFSFTTLKRMAPIAGHIIAEQLNNP